MLDCFSAHTFPNENIAWKYKILVNYIHTYIHDWLLQAFSQDYDLVPYTTFSRYTRPQMLNFRANFGSEAQLGHFSSKMNKERPLQSVAIVMLNEFSQKFKRILATFATCHTAEATLRPVFKDHIIRRRSHCGLVCSASAY